MKFYSSYVQTCGVHCSFFLLIAQINEYSRKEAEYVDFYTDISEIEIDINYVRHAYIMSRPAQYTHFEVYSSVSSSTTHKNTHSQYFTTNTVQCTVYTTVVLVNVQYCTVRVVCACVQTEYHPNYDLPVHSPHPIPNFLSVFHPIQSPSSCIHSFCAFGPFTRTELLRRLL